MTNAFKIVLKYTSAGVNDWNCRIVFPPFLDPKNRKYIILIFIIKYIKYQSERRAVKYDVCQSARIYFSEYCSDNTVGLYSMCLSLLSRKIDCD